MVINLKKVVVFVLLFIFIISLGWIIYSSQKSNNEVPKRATFVNNKLIPESKGVT